MYEISWKIFYPEIRTKYFERSYMFLLWFKFFSCKSKIKDLIQEYGIFWQLKMGCKMLLKNLATKLCLVSTLGLLSSNLTNKLQHIWMLAKSRTWYCMYLYLAIYHPAYLIDLSERSCKKGQYFLNLSEKSPWKGLIFSSNFREKGQF